MKVYIFIYRLKKNISLMYLLTCFMKGLDNSCVLHVCLIKFWPQVLGHLNNISVGQFKNFGKHKTQRKKRNPDSSNAEVTAVFTEDNFLQIRKRVVQKHYTRSVLYIEFTQETWDPKRSPLRLCGLDDQPSWHKAEGLGSFC